MLQGMLKTPLKIIPSEDGAVMHAMKCIDDGFYGFGEAYFSSVKYGAIKAWKRHQKMTLNLVVPVGKVLFVFIDERKDSTTSRDQFKIILSSDPYFRLTVPPGIWFGFRGLDKRLNLIMNIADIPHDPNEVDRKKQEEIQIDWNCL